MIPVAGVADARILAIALAVIPAGRDPRRVKMVRPRTTRSRAHGWRATAALVAALLASPIAARAEATLLDEELVLADAPSPDLTVAAPANGASMDFDLLGEATPPPDAPNARALRLRRKMLTAHQAIGFGLVGLQLAATGVGQLNYSDRFAGGPSTARYELTHATLAYTTLGVFAVNGLVALLAPSPVKKPMKMDRVMVHRLAMLTAATGMLAQGVLGVATRGREGYQNQERLATTHLVIGYATLGALLTGVGALTL
jgi:hypothetical protein